MMRHMVIFIALLFVNVVIAQNENQHIVVISEMATGLQIRYADGTPYPRQSFITDTNIYQIDISPDGHHIAIVREYGDGYPVMELSIYDVLEAREWQVEVNDVNTSEWRWLPKWSPDGTRLAFGVSEIPDLYIYDMATHTAFVLDSLRNARTAFHPSFDWIDSDRLVFVNHLGGIDGPPDLHIYDFTREGSDRFIPLTVGLGAGAENTLGAIEPIYYGREVFFLCYVGKVGEICAIDLETKQIRQVTRLNDDSFISAFYSFGISDEGILLYYLGGDNQYRASTYAFDGQFIRHIYASGRDFSAVWASEAQVQTILTPPIYRATQQGARVHIERAMSAGIDILDSPPVGDGWTFIGRTNGAGDNGTLMSFTVVNDVPYAAIQHYNKGCIIVTPRSLEPRRQGQTRLVTIVQQGIPAPCEDNWQGFTP